jgi:outer membrane protein assembly factor BamE (lipoprotein component of BamABCDE complex)
MAVLTSVALAGCSGSVSGLGEEYTHGYVQSPDAVSQIDVGSSREQVELVLGTPSTTSTIGGESYYYISQKTARSVAFMTPALVDQRVLAVYFDDKGKVKQVANYGLQDGKVFDFIGRRTKTTGEDYGILFQILHAGPTLAPSAPGAK